MKRKYLLVGLLVVMGMAVFSAEENVIPDEGLDPQKGTRIILEKELEEELETKVEKENPTPKNWLSSEIQNRKFFLSGKGHDEETEFRTKLGYGELKLTDKSKLYFDFRRNDYYKGSDKTGVGWDHQLNFYYDHNKITFLNKEWINRFGIGWEGDWNYNDSHDLNWESHDFYLEWNLITFFNDGITPWDKGSHILNFKPLLTEFIVFGESSKYHKPKDSEGWNRWEVGQRQQIGTVWLISRWNEQLSTTLNFRTYLDTIEGTNVYWGGENYSTFYVTQPKPNSFYFSIEGKFEWYWGQGNVKKTAKDKYVEFYIRPQINYKYEIDETKSIDFYTGYDLIEYHYVENPWAKGSYHRKEWITGAKFNIKF